MDSLLVLDYIHKIRTIVDVLASISDPLPIYYHIDLFLQGLSSDYAQVIFVIERKFGIMDLDGVEILLIAHELKLSKFTKSSILDIFFLNLTHTSLHLHASIEY